MIDTNCTSSSGTGGGLGKPLSCDRLVTNYLINLNISINYTQLNVTIYIWIEIDAYRMPPTSPNPLTN